MHVPGGITQSRRVTQGLIQHGAPHAVFFDRIRQFADQGVHGQRAGCIVVNRSIAIGVSCSQRDRVEHGGVPTRRVVTRRLHVQIRRPDRENVDIRQAQMIGHQGVRRLAVHRDAVHGLGYPDRHLRYGGHDEFGVPLYVFHGPQGTCRSDGAGCFVGIRASGTEDIHQTRFHDVAEFDHAIGR